MALAKDRVRYVGDPVASWWPKPGTPPRDAAEAVLLDIDPLPAVTDGPGRRRTGRARAPRRSAGQRGARLPLRRHRGRGRGLRPRRARHPADPAQQPRRGRGHGAALRPGRRWRTAGWCCAWAARACSACATPSPASWACRSEQVRVLTGNVGGSFGMKAGVYPEYIALLHAARAAGPPGEVDGRPVRQLPVRQPRPRPRLDGRTGAGRRGPVPGRPHDRLRQRRRLSQQRDDPARP